MTNQEALDRLRRRLDFAQKRTTDYGRVPIPFSEQDVQALEMAVETLEQIEANVAAIRKEAAQ